MVIVILVIMVLASMNNEGNAESNAVATATTPKPTATTKPVATSEPARPASKFDCRELELEFNTMMVVDYNTALMHVSTVMSLKDTNPMAFYTSADAERELRNCGVIQ